MRRFLYGLDVAKNCKESEEHRSDIKVYKLKWRDNFSAQYKHSDLTNLWVDEEQGHFYVVAKNSQNLR